MHKYGLRLRNFQKATYENLIKGKSVLILAPTGLGKTRAALLPFSLGQWPLLNTRLIYALPMRVLAKGVADEYKDGAIIHHGDEPESRFFSERMVITTVDQYFTAFAGAPLSWASHLSHAAAGAVLTSYSVFDEVHLLSPQKGLQLLFAILRLRQRWGLLSCVMTATLPPSVITFLEEFCGLERIEASPDDVQQRDEWRKVRIQLFGNRVFVKKRRKKVEEFRWQEIDCEELCRIVEEKWNQWENIGVDGPKKMIVFVNTVDRAIELYRRIKEAGFCPKVFLAHSRFAKQDRQKIEEDLHTYFGKDANPDDEAILITTQVAEAGLNISAPLVISELCPMDSLIQRAGRCQRFRPNTGKELKGKVLVVKPSGERWFAPYGDRIRLVEISKDKKGKIKKKYSKRFPALDLTRLIVERENIDSNGLLLDWGKEKELIQKALDRLYMAYLAGITDVEFQKGEEPFQTHFSENRSKKEESGEGENDVQ